MDVFFQPWSWLAEGNQEIWGIEPIPKINSVTNRFVIYNGIN